jgi:hypothetical protein
VAEFCLSGKIMHPHSPPIWLFFALFPVVFVVIWCSVCMILSLSGWGRLAARFRARTAPSGSPIRVQRGKVGIGSYNGCLNVYTTPDGIFLAVVPIFRLGHPPLFIPLKELNNPRVYKYFSWETVVFDIGTPRIISIQLPSQVFDGLNLSLPAPR